MLFGRPTVRRRKLRDSLSMIAPGKSGHPSEITHGTDPLFLHTFQTISSHRPCPDNVIDHAVPFAQGIQRHSGVGTYSEPSYAGTQSTRKTVSRSCGGESCRANVSRVARLADMAFRHLQSRASHTVLPGLTMCLVTSRNTATTDARSSRGAGRQICPNHHGIVAHLGSMASTMKSAFEPSADGLAQTRRVTRI